MYCCVVSRPRFGALLQHAKWRILPGSRAITPMIVLAAGPKFGSVELNTHGRQATRVANHTFDLNGLDGLNIELVR